jgi:MFS family permease
MLEGLFSGILITHDVVARRYLGASEWQLALLTMTPNACQLLALVLADRFERVPRPRLFLWAGILGRLILLLAAWVAGPWSFIGILVLQALVQTVVIPALNALYQANYRPEIRGRLFGRAQVFAGVATASAALLAGLTMDRHPDAFRWLYPAAGIAGFASCMVYGAIKIRRTDSAPRPAPERPVPGREDEPEDHLLARLSRPFSRTFLATLRGDPAFRRFEGAMFVYGLGFMCMQPVFAILFVNELDIPDSQAYLAKGVVFAAVPVVALGMAGRMHDRVGLERVATRSYVVLAVFAVAMALVQDATQLVAAFALFGLGMAGVNIAWTMGPIRYAPPGQAARYMGVHVALVGFRALVGHPVGAWVAKATGSSRPTFVLAAFLFGAAALLMMRAERLYKGSRAGAPVAGPGAAAPVAGPGAAAPGVAGLPPVEDRGRVEGDC